VHLTAFIFFPQLPSSQSRNPPILPPSLQLTRFPSPKNGTSTPALCPVLSTLLPLFSVMQLSLESLNNDRFIPESDGEDLSSGYLQIPNGSVMLLTETGIQEGNVVEKGILTLILTSSTQPLVASGMRSLRDVQDVISNQNLRYAFPFSQFSFNTEIGFVLLVEGRRSPFFMVGSPSCRTRYRSHWCSYYRQIFRYPSNLKAWQKNLCTRASPRSRCRIRGDLMFSETC